MSKILLLQPMTNWYHPFCETPSLALLTLGTLAQNAGHEVRIYHLDIDAVDVKSELLSYQPDIVGITSNTFQVKNAKELASLTKETSRDIQVVVGGPHAIAWDGVADKVVVGEGDNQWLEMLGERPMESIDDMPMYNYDLIDMRRFSGVGPMGGVPSTVTFGSRGCPYQCSYCNTPVFWGKKVRYRSPEKIVAQIAFLHERYGMKEVFMQDDTFNVNHAWAFEIFDRIIAAGLHRKMVFRIDCRVNERLLTEAFLQKARDAGVWNIFFGVESGSQVMLDRMNKGITPDEIRRALRMTHEYGITDQCSFIVGLPGETWATLRETQDLIQEIQPKMMGWCFACPFPGTAFEREVTAKGHKRLIPYEEYGYGPEIMVRTDELSYEDFESFGGFKIGRSFAPALQRRLTYAGSK